LSDNPVVGGALAQCNLIFVARPLGEGFLRQNYAGRFGALDDGGRFLMHTLKFADLDRARVLADELFFPECPRFVRDEVYFVDGPAVRAVSLGGRIRTIADIPTPLCLGLQVGDDGEIYVGAAFDRKIYKIDGGAVTLAADLSGVISSPTNELVRLANGSMIVGDMGFNIMTDPAPRPGGLYLVAPDGTVTKTGPDIMFPNGMMLVDDGATLLVVGAMGASIYRLQLNADGKVQDYNEIALTAGASADGLAKARDGAFWYGDMALGAAVRHDPNGAPPVAILTGKPHATACAVFSDGREEWLAITIVVAHPTPENADKRTGQLLLAPMASVFEALKRSDVSGYVYAGT
jgi:sugar lactone lactonase YvrE